MGSRLGGRVLNKLDTGRPPDKGSPLHRCLNALAYGAVQLGICKGGLSGFLALSAVGSPKCWGRWGGCGGVGGVVGARGTAGPLHHAVSQPIRVSVCPLSPRHPSPCKNNPLRKGGRS